MMLFPVVFIWFFENDIGDMFSRKKVIAKNKDRSFIKKHVKTSREYSEEYVISHVTILFKTRSLLLLCHNTLWTFSIPHSSRFPDKFEVLNLYDFN
jgi:hypothetical protein